MSRLASEVRRVAPTTGDLVKLLARISGRDPVDIEDEIAEHLAARISFLLLGEMEEAENFESIRMRVVRRVNASADTVRRLTDEIAQTLAWIDAAETGRKTSLRELPYPLRMRLQAKQAGRCGVCGLLFSDGTPQRKPEECVPTLDHRLPYRLGGERVDNLWILCALCNSIKESRIHVGEHGRVWINNHVYYSGVRQVVFWTLMRDAECVICGATPTQERLGVRRRHDCGAWVIDNCEVVCAHGHGHGGVFGY